MGGSVNSAPPGVQQNGGAQKSSIEPLLAAKWRLPGGGGCSKMAALERGWGRGTPKTTGVPRNLRGRRKGRGRHGWSPAEPERGIRDSAIRSPGFCPALFAPGSVRPPTPAL